MSTLLKPLVKRTSPPPDGVLVRLLALSICASDRRVLAGRKRSKLTDRPTTLGHEGGGIVVDPGPSRFHVGQKVVALPHLACGRCDACRAGRSNLCENLGHLGFDLDGVLAIAGAFDERVLYPVEASFPDDALPLVEPLACAFRAVRRAGRFLSELPTHAQVAVFGAGPMGGLLSLAVRRDYPDLCVTLADAHPVRRRIAAELHLADQVAERVPAGRAAVVFDATSSAGSAWAALAALKQGGALLLFAGKDQTALEKPEQERLRFLERVHRHEEVVPPEEGEGRWLVGTSGYTYTEVQRAERELVARFGYWSQIQNVVIEGLESREAVFLRPRYRVAHYDRPAVEVLLAPGGVDDPEYGDDVARVLKVLIRTHEDG